MTFPYAQLIKIGLPILGVCFILGFGYCSGYRAGAESVQSKWDAEQEAYEDRYEALSGYIAQLERLHRDDQRSIADELAKVREEHAAALGSQRVRLERQLLQSSRRAEVYRRQAEAGAAACSDLASHAARLDRSLAEGRGVVEELRGTLGLRDRQARLLGEQIRADRRLMTEDKNDEPHNVQE